MIKYSHIRIIFCGVRHPWLQKITADDFHIIRRVFYDTEKFYRFSKICAPLLLIH